jgi:hypothetical protein
MPSAPIYDIFLLSPTTTAVVVLGKKFRDYLI